MSLLRCRSSGDGKTPRREKARGRVSGSAALAYECFQKRDWSQMPVNGCWIADGKSLEMKVAHPDHGRPFTPELTLIIDGRTRFVVGWSWHYLKALLLWPMPTVTPCDTSVSRCLCTPITVAVKPTKRLMLM